MADIVYQRPREKLRERGVAALTLVELIQVLLGSGVRGYPVGKIARQVAVVIESSGGQDVQYHLRKIKGLGEVKTAQLLAAVELSGRVSRQKIPATPVYEAWLGAAARHGTVRYCLLDGAGEVIVQGEHHYGKAQHYGYVVRSIMRHAIERRAAALACSIRMRRGATGMDIYELGVFRLLFEQADNMYIAVRSALLVYDTGVRLVKRKDVT